MMFGKSFGLVVSALALGVVACGGTDTQQQARNPEVTTTTGATNSQQSESSMGSSQGNTSMSSMNPSEHEQMQGQMGQNQMQQQQMPQQQQMGQQLTDAQIVSIVDTVHKGEVDQGQLAVRKAKDAQVKQFAQMMTTDHGGSMNKFKQLGITPETTQTSTQLQTDSQNAIQSLSGQTGMDFDRAYMDLQVKEHQQVLNDLDQKLIPNAKNAELKKNLTDLRSKVAEHLQKAEQIQQKLGLAK